MLETPLGQSAAKTRKSNVQRLVERRRVVVHSKREKPVTTPRSKGFIMISREYLNERFEYEDGELYWKVVYSNRLKIGQIAGDRDGRGYRRVMLGKQHYKMHRLIWIMHNGDIPEGIVADHIDRDIDNNKIENLRLATKSENALNVGNKY